MINSVLPGPACYLGWGLPSYLQKHFWFYFPLPTPKFDLDICTSSVFCRLLLTETKVTVLEWVSIWRLSKPFQKPQGIQGEYSSPEFPLLWSICGTGNQQPHEKLSHWPVTKPCTQTKSSGTHLGPHVPQHINPPPHWNLLSQSLTILRLQQWGKMKGSYDTHYALQG